MDVGHLYGPSPFTWECPTGAQILSLQGFWRERIAHQNVTIYVGIYVSLNNPQLPITLMQPQTTMLPPPCLTLGKKQLSCLTRVLLCTLHTIWAKPVYLGLIRPQEMVPVTHVLGLPVFSKLCRLSSALASEEASFWDDGFTDRFDAVCDLTLLQSLQQCWYSSIYFFEANLWRWSWMQGLNFFGQLWWSINGINIIYFQRTVKLYCCTRQCTDSILVLVGNAQLYQSFIYIWWK